MSPYPFDPFLPMRTYIQDPLYILVLADPSVNSTVQITDTSVRTPSLGCLVGTQGYGGSHTSHLFAFGFSTYINIYRYLVRVNGLCEEEKTVGVNGNARANSGEWMERNQMYLITSTGRGISNENFRLQNKKNDSLNINCYKWFVWLSSHSVLSLHFIKKLTNY